MSAGLGARLKRLEQKAKPDYVVDKELLDALAEYDRLFNGDGAAEDEPPSNVDAEDDTVERHFSEAERAELDREAEVMGIKVRFLMENLPVEEQEKIPLLKRLRALSLGTEASHI